MYDNFNIESKNIIKNIKAHNDCVLCLTIMNDGRLVSGAVDGTIVIHDKKEYTPDLIIKEHKGCVNYIINLSSGLLASCSDDKTIKLYNINGKEYKVLQTLNNHKDFVYKIIELKNRTLASCSEDCSIILYLLDNSEYKKVNEISTIGICTSIIQTKDDEICYSENNNDSICFFDLSNNIIKASLSNINKRNGNRERLLMINKDLLLIPGKEKISIINVMDYKLVRVIDVPGAGWICGVCMLNNNMLLTGDSEKVIRQWKIDGDNLNLVSKKEGISEAINDLLNLGNGYIALADDDYTVQIW